ncbi:MAG TPA: hypothetical protein VJ913_02375 [Actinomycetota bacterium]|nr:hypothetical protein [Actinomycetota bacterium]
MDDRIEKLLGRGGMSVVYLAEHVRLKRKAANKVHSPRARRGPEDHAVAERLDPDRALHGTIDDVVPEQIAGKVVDGRTDQFALACVL